MTSSKMNTEELQKIFNEFDANNDGLISLTELENVMKTMGSSYSQEELQNLMNGIDTDKDGFINVSEFASICNGGGGGGGGSASSTTATTTTDPTSLSTQLRDAFDLYDQDKNGKVSAQELHSVMSKLKMTCTVEDCVKMIQSVDATGDGNVNLDEFVKMMTNPMNMAASN